VLKYALEFNPLAQLLAEAFWPGPLTLLLPKRDIVPDEVTSGLSRVALRVPGHPMARKLLEALDFPLAAPSANPFGYISPTCAQHVVNQLNQKIPYVLDGGSSNVGVESTIVGFEDDVVVVYRLGGTAFEKIEQVIGDKATVKLQPNQSSDPSNPSAPGMLKSHYSPKKRLTLIETGADVPIQEDKSVKVGLISLIHRDDSSSSNSSSSSSKLAYQMSLCKSGTVDPNEAAKNLFAALRFMDDTDKCDVIYVEKCVDIGLGRAINDRLARAACQEIHK
jgi:L-threonylcarbamoyladenylate synthase